MTMVDDDADVEDADSKVGGSEADRRQDLSVSVVKKEIADVKEVASSDLPATASKDSLPYVGRPGGPCSAWTTKEACRAGIRTTGSAGVTLAHADFSVAARYSFPKRVSFKSSQKNL